MQTKESSAHVCVCLRLKKFPSAVLCVSSEAGGEKNHQIVKVANSLQKLIQYIEAEQFKGYDPYDALNSPVLSALSLKTKPLRVAVTQLMKKCPVNLRPFLFVEKDYNPKSLGLFLWGYAKLYSLDSKKEYLETITTLLTLLEGLKSHGYSGHCWGYNFDWQGKKFFAPKFTPNIVSSSFVGHALLDTYRLTGNEKALAMAIPIKDFILGDLKRIKDNGRICFGYTPLAYSTVHNANLLGASLLMRLSKYGSDNGIRDAAMAGLAYSMGHQKQDGSWLYGEASSCGWIDSFHTGYNLQSILWLLEEGVADQYRPAFENGVRFYAENFFLEDGTPKYYHDRIYPIDIHAPAQAVVLFSKMGPSYKDLRDRVARWMIENLQDPDGYFYFQKNRHYTNKVSYMRWSQAWAFHALTELMVSENGGW